MNVRRLRPLITVATVAACVIASPGAGSAATGPAQGTRLVGACNMLRAWPGGAGVPAGGGMENAMNVANSHGNDGMWLAVEVSGCPLRP